jgi:hypothetical protein
MDKRSKAMNDRRPQYWFPAKRYGWGWGLPTCWQGWAVLVVYLGAVTGMAPFITAHAGKPQGLLFVLGMTVLLLYVIYKKGEPPGWHWGD